MPPHPQLLSAARVYAKLAATEFRRYSTYRLAVLAGLFTNSVFGFIRVSVLAAAIGANGAAVAGYDAKQASTYVWLGQAYIAPLAIMGGLEIADRVKSGEIAVDLARPLDLYASWWARDLGRAGFGLISRGILPLLIGAATVGLALPPVWTAYPLGLVSLFVAVSISFTLRFMINLLAFWVLDVRGFQNFYFVLISLLSGFLIPVHFFPPLLQTIAYASPAPSVLQLPVDVMSGRVVGGEALATIGVQLGWLAGLVVLARVMQWAAARRLVVQGG